MRNEPAPPDDNDTDPDNKPRWQRRPQARPEEIIRAALRTFVERGYAATRLEDIAQLAGVSKGTLYLYYSNKEALFQATVRANITPGIEAAEQRVADHTGTALELLEQLYRNWAQALMDPLLGSLCKLIIAEAGNFPDTARLYVEEVVLRLRALFRSVIERAMAAGELRPLPAEHVVRELMTPILFLSVWRHSLAVYEPRPLTTEEFLDTHWDMVLHGLLPQPGGAR